MMNLNLLESLSLSCNCFPWKRPEGGDGDETIDQPPKPKGLPKGIVEVASELKVTVLPSWLDIDLLDLYPSTNRVDTWCTFIVGRDKNYILANIGDPHIQFPGSNNLLNKKGTKVLPEELDRVFSKIWDETFAHSQLQFCLLWNSVLYVVNSWALKNSHCAAVGAILVMRSLENLPEVLYREHGGMMFPAGFCTDDACHPKHPNESWPMNETAAPTPFAPRPSSIVSDS